MVTYLVMALAVVSLTQMLLLVLVWGHVRRTSRTHERLSHFAEALALLTDTMEAGLANVTAELESGGRRAPRSSTRAATAKRIVSAVRTGKSIEEIVSTEAISESEIRLHLGMNNRETVSREGGRHGAVLG